NLPFAVPMTYRCLARESGEPVYDGLSMFLLNENLWRDFRDDDFSDEDFETFSFAMQTQSSGALAARHLEFVREGGVALELEGDTRAAVLFFATSCEVLLDEVLAHMLWEEAVRPEDAADILDANQWLTQRVKGLYHHRLGGSWDVHGDGPVGAW